MDKAKLDVSRMEELYRNGAIAKNKLDQAKDSLEDVTDNGILRQTLFGELKLEDLSTQQIDEMLAAARRRVERVKPRIEAKQVLVNEGVLARGELAPDLEELKLRQQTLALAEGRAQTFELLLDAIRAGEEAAARAEEARVQSATTPMAERYRGKVSFRLAMLKPIEEAFEKKFNRPLPISALGMTEIHRTMGFDHRERVDIALTPDSDEGTWLRSFLKLNRVPYFAFRSFIPGSATGAHIHIGTPSLRLPQAAAGPASAQ